jgi:hypothetical protein
MDEIMYMQQLRKDEAMQELLYFAAVGRKPDRTSMIAWPNELVIDEADDSCERSVWEVSVMGKRAYWFPVRKRYQAN